MNAGKLLEKATAMLLYSEPFYGTLLLRLKRVAVGSEVCKVASTDGACLYYNPEGLAKLSFDQIKTLLMHECGHLAYAHHVRMAGKDPRLANMAGDHVVNLILKKGAYAPIEGWLADPKFEGQTFEQVYAHLQQQGGGGGGGGQQPPPQGQQQQKQKQQQQQKQQQPGQQPPRPPGGPQGQQPGQQPGQQAPPQAADTPGGFGQILPCAPDQKHNQEQEWKLAVEQAAAAARAAGKLPAHLKRMVEEIREAKLDWREILRQFIAQTAPSDFTWSRPNKRTLSQGIYLPGVKKEGIGELVFSIDASGSIGKRELTEFVSEISYVQQDLKPEKITLVSHDTRCHLLGEYTPGDDITFDRIRGGGGTDFRCVFDWIAEQGVQPRALVMLTDLYGSFPKYDPGYPVLWISTTRQIAPFGETVRMLQ
jgi:predicted metal-dependent peptidase